MKSFPECEEYRTDPKIVLGEKRSKIIFLNPKRNKVLVIEVDGCAIKDDKILRCDYAIVPCDRVEIYVELKGGDISHALKQIESTIRIISDSVKEVKKYCFIVSTRVPALTTSLQNSQIQFKNKFNANLKVKCTQLEFNLNEAIK
jgi:sporulation-control protein spo0M